MRPVIPLALVTGLLSGFAGGLLAADHTGGTRTERTPEAVLPSIARVSGTPPAPAAGPSTLSSPPGVAAPRRSAVPRPSSVSPRAPAEDAPDAAKQPPPALGRLLPDLEALLAEGALGPDLAGRRNELTRLLVNTWLDLEQPHRALDVLRNGTQNRNVARRVAAALGERGDTAAAFEALALVFRSHRYDFRLAHEMAKWEPEAALALAETLWAEEGVADTLPVRAARARMLASAERPDEALEIARELLAEDPAHSAAWELLGELDPEGTIETLREQAAPGVELRLAELLVKSDRPEEALPILEASFRSGDSSSEALERLLELEPERGLALLDASEAVELDNWLFQDIGNALLAADRPDEAVDAWYRYFDESPSDAETNGSLREHDPDGFWRRFQAKAEADENDEVWGDLADEYWRVGEHDRAKQAWQRAHRMDPDDGEWTGKLEKVALGREPL